MALSIEPLLDRVVLTPIRTEKTSRGLFYADDAQDKMMHKARVVAIGPGKAMVHEGKMINFPLGLQVGDIVVINHYAGMKMDLGDDQEYLILKEDEIIGKVVEKAVTGE